MRTFTCAICGTEVADTTRPAWCPGCHASGTMRPPIRRPITQHLAAEARELTAKEIVQASWDIQQCSATGLSWVAGTVVLLYGLPGSGKSTLAVQIAAQVEPVLLCSLEEDPSPALERRLVIAGMGGRTDVKVVDTATIAKLTQYAKKGAALVIDSLTYSTLVPADLRALGKLGAALVIGVVHATKKATIKGDSSFTHAAQMIIRVDPGGHWVAEKTRFGPAGVEGWVRGVATAVAPDGESPDEDEQEEA